MGCSNISPQLHSNKGRVLALSICQLYWDEVTVKASLPIIYGNGIGASQYYPIGRYLLGNCCSCSYIHDQRKYCSVFFSHLYIWAAFNVPLLSIVTKSLSWPLLFDCYFGIVSAGFSQNNFTGEVKGVEEKKRFTWLQL